MSKSRLALATILGSLLLWGCGAEVEKDPGSNPLNATFDVSECGGFARAAKADLAPGYCDAEVLDWSYDGASGKLSLSDKRVLLNCCGDHSVTVTQDSSGTFVITEIDAPQAQNGGARCHCMCVYDFDASFSIYSAGGLVPIKLVRDVTDDNEPPKTVFSGQLNLSAGSGSEVLDTTDVGMWCESSAPQDPSSQSFAISECGGFEAKSDSSFGGYCDAEVLDWSYDAASGALIFTDKRALLNCCGDRSMQVSEKNGTYVITEIDAPEGGDGRCLCMCVFDLKVTYNTGVVPVSGMVPIVLVRDTIDDSKPPVTLYSGSIDLSAGSGSVVVDTTDAGPWCDQNQP
jgi:hypothetical protein